MHSETSHNVETTHLFDLIDHKHIMFMNYQNHIFTYEYLFNDYITPSIKNSCFNIRYCPGDFSKITFRRRIRANNKEHEQVLYN